MRRTAWIWLGGTAVWLADGVVSLGLRAYPHAVLAFVLAALFFVAWQFYRRQRR